MTNFKIYGTLEEGFYLVRPLHCSTANKNHQIVGACRAGFSGVGALYMDGDQAVIETCDGHKLKVYRNDKIGKGIIRLRDLEYLRNVQSLANTYRRRADFIESKMRELVGRGKLEGEVTDISFIP